MPAHLCVDRNSILADEPVNISASHLAPGQPAEFSLSCGPWRSNATFIADTDGRIDLADATAIDGSYHGNDPMGLFWSMRADSTDPLPMFTPMPDRLQLSLSVAETLDTIFIERFYAAPGVQRIEVRDDGLCGVLYLPVGRGPHPCILSLGGSDGGLGESTAAVFASRGFATFALAYFNYSTLQSDLCEIPLEYFGSAVEWLKRHPNIDPGRLSVRGVSRGGELSLQLGSVYDDFKAVLALVPSSVRWGSISETDARTNRAAWTHNGRPLPYNRRATDWAGASMNGPVAFTPDFLRAMEDEETVAEATIEVEKINGPVLLFSGEDDAMWPSTYFSTRVMKRLKEHQFPHHAQHESFPGAGHRVALLPYQPTTSGPMIHPVIGKPVAFGGTPEADARGTLAGWCLALEFLEKQLL